MAYFKIPNVTVKGMSACVPAAVEKIEDYPLFSEAEKARMLPFFGLDKHHVASDSICASDLCFAASERLIDNLQWEKDSIDLLVFVSPAPDYIFPTTACILHNRLGLKRECAAFDIPFGCSGWVYGMTVVGNLLSSGSIKRAILLVGDTPTRAASKQDKSVYPFFGDAGTATAIEFEKDAYGFRSELGTIEKDWDKIILPAGGFRNPITEDSLIPIEEGPGITRTKFDTHMDGMDVFSLSTTQDPISVNSLLEKSGINIDDVDCFGFHQTNAFLMNRVCKRLKLNQEKVPYSLKEFANTSGASIPLTLVTERAKRLKNEKMRIAACALGVGLSYGAVYFETDNIVVPQLVEL